MSRKKVEAVETLVRWRELKEAIAKRAYRSAALRESVALGASDAANKNLADIQRRRTELLSEATIDLMRVQAVAEIETGAWSVVDQKLAELADARTRTGEALSLHCDARAQSRVADARRERIASVHADRCEKLSFDRMSALRATITDGAEHD
jgi:hypothetical protein